MSKIIRCFHTTISIIYLPEKDLRLFVRYLLFCVVLCGCYCLNVDKWWVMAAVMWRVMSYLCIPLGLARLCSTSHNIIIYNTSTSQMVPVRIDFYDDWHIHYLAILFNLSKMQRYWLVIHSWILFNPKTISLTNYSTRNLTHYVRIKEIIAD